MAKAKSVYSCTECGATSPKWAGQCPGCSGWNTLVETVAEQGTGAHRFASLAGTAQVQTLADIRPRDEPRLATGLEEFDRVLGGGLVPGGVVLIGGDPGIGKSTLLLQALAQLASRVSTLYITGEESGEQVALRAQRLALDPSGLQLLAEINLEKIGAVLNDTRPRVVVVDSIQTVYSEQLTSAPGSVAQVRECAAQLTRAAKQAGHSLILVGHVTKEGTLAGPRVLEHIVDTVLYFEGETSSSFRLIRAFKNRYGAVNELGVFAMTERGLRGVSNPSAMFLSHHAQPVSGSCVMVTQEGTRPLLVEIQALVDSAHGNPRRLTVGLDAARLAMLLAVLHRHAGVVCADQDVFVNAVGGVKIGEPAGDLAVLLAIVSSLKNRPLPQKMVAFGEVGLAGEIRPAPRGQERLREAAKLGFTHALIPKANAPKQKIEGLTIIPVERIEEAFAKLRELE
ncbi:DNA repair protein RadA [Methyloversatilis sp. XJ19-13]|uniref:DNA repair protein RadA n=1 Tax=Methyloversatilis sp. XJ19-13 TaxID=2963430 RepID=UPI00211BD254|nr:DNA repair protein RadA [Methyloversatilis sp. XJ19-13]MCQ9376339.1 DNA repair protein RadA [Methyloversatilis sp. XJ19-13]